MGVGTARAREVKVLAHALNAALSTLHQAMGDRNYRLSDLMSCDGPVRLVPLTERQAHLLAACALSGIDYREKCGAPCSAEERHATIQLLAALSMPFSLHVPEEALDAFLDAWAHRFLVAGVALEAQP